MKKLFEIIGARTLKTVIAIILSVIIASALGVSNTYIAFAPFAAIIVLTDSVYNTVHTSINRIVGTIIGGLYTFILLFIGVNSYVILSLGIIILFKILLYFKLKEAISMAGFVLIAMCLSSNTSDSLVVYAFERVIGTIIGIIVANLVNRYLYPPDITKLLRESLVSIADLAIYLKEKIIYSEATKDLDDFNLKFEIMNGCYEKLVKETKYIKISKNEKEKFTKWKEEIDNAYHFYQVYNYLKKENDYSNETKVFMEENINKITNNIEKIREDITT